MRMSASDIVSHPQLRSVLRAQSEALSGMHRQSPGVSSIFATQQYWLLAQIFMAMMFESADRGVLLADFKDAAHEHGVASRNTAAAFHKLLVHYGLCVDGAPRADRRARPQTASPSALASFTGWLQVHLATVDALDGGMRAARLAGDYGVIASVQPKIAAGLLQSRLVTEPAPGFSLFTWLKEGGIVMDRLVGSIQPIAPGATQVPTQVPTGMMSYQDIGEDLMLSRPHLLRKLLMAEEMGSLGWSGPRGRSRMWISTDFIAEYDAYQAEKLAIVAAAFDQALEDEVAIKKPALL